MGHDLHILTRDTEMLARKAGAEIMSRYHRRDAKIFTKSDESPVTDADMAAEQILLAGLAAITPDIPVVSEESVEAGRIPNLSGGRFWVVDPLDGTKEFISRTGAFVVALALIDNGVPVLGVVYHPAFDVMFSAYGPGTATRLGPDGHRQNIEKSDQIAGGQKIKALYNPQTSTLEEIAESLKKRFNAVVEWEPKPGLLRACQIAESSADISVVAPKAGLRVKWWDIAPAQVIVESAGGSVTTLKGEKLTYTDGDLSVDNAVYVRPGLKL
jgi:3'(2'), 5'-bisphosphate nucleotidase